MNYSPSKARALMTIFTRRVDPPSLMVLCELSENIRPFLSTLGALVAWKEVPGLA